MNYSEERERLLEEYNQDLKNNPKYIEFYKNFGDNKIEVDSFIQSYSRTKANYMVYGKFYHDHAQKDRESFQEEANQYLYAIMQKKLFDLQCLWRAEKIQLPGIELSIQFRLYEDNITSCKFLDDITREEVQVLCKYVMENAHYKDSLDYLPWQEYPENKNDDDPFYELESWSDWYDYYNKNLNKPDLLNLMPDIRGGKEKMYLDYERDKLREAVPQTPPQPKEPEPKYKWANEAMEDFMKLFEKRAFFEYKKAYETESEYDYHEHIEQLIKILVSSNQTEPIEANANWLKGLENAAETSWRKQMIAEIWNAYELYLTSKDLNIELPTSEEPENHMEYMVDFHRKRILKARLALGEPEDLNF
jgi:hypothetical protein